jgi:Fe2+ or Zn2+ uptake regulation protein
MLSESGNIHFSAAEAHQRLLDNGNKVSLATVYNNLKEFVDAGIIRSIAGHHRQVIFDTNVEPHHHVVNRRTGMISDTDQIDYLLKETFPPRRRSRAMGMEFAEPSPYACRVNQRP